MYELLIYFQNNVARQQAFLNELPRLAVPLWNRAEKAAFSVVMTHFRSWLTSIGVATSHPLAFVVVAIYVAVWLIIDPHSFSWESGATVAVWIMTLFIQRAEHRDTQAIHAKLDELLRAEGSADQDVATLDREEPEEIEAHREEMLR